MTETAIDRAVFDTLTDSVGNDFIGELVATFSEEAPVIIANLRQALLDQNVDNFRREAHSMKTNAATFGAYNLAELARTLEHLARENQLNQIGDQVDELEYLYQTAQGELERLSNVE